jgi:hypothetical protein
LPTESGKARQKAVHAKGLHGKEEADRIREVTPGNGIPENRHPYANEMCSFMY